VADITDRRRAEQAVLRQAEQLARSNRDLVELDRLKNEFVSTVSHELRTPLTTILGYTELLTESSEHLSPAERRIVATIDRNGERLLALIEDLLTFSALDGGRLPVRRAHLDLATLIVEACAQAAPGDRPDRVEVDLADDLPPLDADAGQMQRVLATLLSNAVTHSPDGTPVRVTGRVADGHVVVSVRDSGVGIPEHEQAQLFTPFYRTSYAQQHAIKGSGLGLAIAKAIVDTHGGWMRLSSTPGAGTTVSFGLPATR
jgi:signal transduction histidine kinase